MISLLPGDIVCSHFPSAFGWFITEAEKRDPTGLPEYTHSFIVTGEDGATLDTTLTVHTGNIYADYAGSNMIIGRFANPDPEKIQTALGKVSEDLGKEYPGYRLALDALDLGAVVAHQSKVCSERTVYYAHLASDIEDLNWPGWTPAQLAMAIKHWREFQVVYRGILPCG
jgi:hypothetical protein